MTTQTFEEFGFAEPLSRALTQCGYTTPTPIQVQALPPQLEGRDLLGMAETGSGKTATFLLPILNKIATDAIEPGWKQVVALILAPTRELAVQIDQEVAKLSRNMNIRRAVVLGGVSKGPQINALKRGVHVLVATPGRLLDHVNMRSCDLSGVQTLVIDEADRMFDMGFIRDINKIVSLIPQKRRTALFSATMPVEIKKFAYDILHDPYRVDLSSKTIVVDRIDQKVMMVRSAEKQSRLHTILADEEAKRVIVFTRTKRGADRVADRLGMAGISSSAFHGNKAQNARQRALNDFTLGHIRVLVATDIAARGIDVSNITHVVNFDMPLDPETYVHRVGRTARKGTTGIAISLCDPSERGEIRAIEKMMKQPLVIMDDIGGEVLPMPERRRDDDAPRREGAPRGGRGGAGHRGGGSRPNHQAGSGRPRSERPFGDRDRSNGDRSGDRRGDRPNFAATRRPYTPAGASDAHVGEGAAVFGVSDRTHESRSADRPHQDGAHRGPRRDHRGDRPAEHRSGPHRSGDQRPGEHRFGERRGEHRPDSRPARHADGAGRPDRGHAPGGRHRDDAGHSKREGGHGPRKPHHGGGEGRPSWKSGSGSDAPKFMKRRDDSRDRDRTAN
ncbi:DEAD/DEAH box helicase [Hyphomicrobium sp.]|uniref:DEAD/DEAH box helicase n=1 Tax=Hyphomicrobium sp. TaxID=82 RepID=UPI001DF3788B|nr:DEAD/DEAH box helicase [Hyphomicrobium sp.]MBY0558976.1 DEAD/DEAH box helicase [Hyphomicrobium sp.]